LARDAGPMTGPQRRSRDRPAAPVLRPTRSAGSPAGQWCSTTH